MLVRSIFAEDIIPNPNDNGRESAQQSQSRVIGHLPSAEQRSRSGYRAWSG
jgi:hypothetical protein